MFCSPDMQISEGYYFAFFKFWTQSDKALPLHTAWYHFEGGSSWIEATNPRRLCDCFTEILIVREVE